MKANRSVGFLLLLGAAVFQLTDQQLEADRKLLEAIKTAAEKGDPKGQYELAGVYFAGKLGVAKDFRIAADWYHKSAQQGYADAQLMIGACYSSGIGVAKDMRETVLWIRKAAEQNLPIAQCILGAFYHDGDGVTSVVAHK